MVGNINSFSRWAYLYYSGQVSKIARVGVLLSEGTRENMPWQLVLTAMRAQLTSIVTRTSSLTFPKLRVGFSKVRSTLISCIEPQTRCLTCGGATVSR
jgi:hypothetical protein